MLHIKYFLTNDCDISYGEYKLPNPTDKNYTNDKRKTDIFNVIKKNLILIEFLIL